MTRAEWVQFNEFERRAPHCSICATLLPLTSFIDNHARKTVRGSRCRLACGIRTGTYQISFKLGGILSFACGGCRQAMPLPLEDSCVENVTWRNSQRHQSPSGLSGNVPSATVVAVATADPVGVSSVGMRWCRECWRQRTTTVRLAGA